MLIAGLLVVTAVESEAAPFARTGGSYNMLLGGSIVLNGATSFTSPDTTSIVSYDWDIDGDGIFGDLTGAEPSLIHADFPMLAGVRTISLRVTDSIGATNVASTSLIVNPSHLAVHNRFHRSESSAAGPYHSPVYGTDGQTLYGTTQNGGKFDRGTIWRIHKNGTGFTVLHHCDPQAGGSYHPNGLILGNDGWLYGTSQSGGTGGHGTIWRIGTNGFSFTVLRDLVADSDGRASASAPVLGSDGRLYGTNGSGGSSDNGTVWRMNRDGSAFTVLRHFSSGTDGRSLQNSPVFGSDGKLYGTAHAGGASGGGTVWQMNADGSGFAVLRPFSGSEGQSTSVILGPDGKLYGQSGIANRIWRMNTDGTGFVVLRQFSVATEGSLISAGGGFVFGNDGWLYGRTNNGDTPAGTIWRMNTDGSGFSILRNMVAASDGRSMVSAPIFGTDGLLYGTAASGGANSVGTLWRMAANGSGFAVVRPFDYLSTGADPRGAPVLGNDGWMYGTTAAGGRTNQGVVWRMKEDGRQFSVLKHFDNIAAPSSPVQPRSAPVIGPDGRLYGTALGGGSGFNGVVWRMNVDGSNFVVLRSFSSSTGGAELVASPAFGNDGLIYGTARTGGAFDQGTVWRMSADGNGFTVIAHFSSIFPGIWPEAAPVFGPDGRLYGTCSSGGSNNGGTLWRVNPDGSAFTVLRHFQSAMDGSRPVGSPLFGPDGRLYGTCSLGALNNLGSVWQINPDGSGFNVLRTFGGSPAIGGPKGSLVFGSDGALYFTHSSDGTNGDGALWRYQIGSFSQIGFGFLFSVTGAGPQGGAAPGSNGRILTSASRGGISGQNNGTIIVWSNQPPIASFTATPNPATVGTSVTFDASASNDREGYPQVYDWVFGDGVSAVVSNNPITTHTYATPGLFTASLEVTDLVGATSSVVTVNISVTTANQAPVAHSQSLGAAEDTALAVTLTGSDPDSNPLTYAVVSSPAHGTLAGVAPALTYTPAANYFGPDSFTFKVNDGTTDSALATVSLNVTPVNDAPALASPGNHTVDELALLSFTLAATDVDTADTLSYSISAGNLAGMNLVASTGAFSWTPTAQQGPGSYSVTFRVTDSGGLFDEKTIALAVNEPVVAGPTDVTAQLQITVTGFRLNRATGRYAQTITVRNVGGSPIAGPVSLVFDHVPAQATLAGATGVTSAASPLGSPFVDLAVGADGVLTPGESVVTTVEFGNPSNQAITYTSRVLAGSGIR